MLERLANMAIELFATACVMLEDPEPHRRARRRSVRARASALRPVLRRSGPPFQGESDALDSREEEVDTTRRSVAAIVEGEALFRERLDSGYLKRFERSEQLRRIVPQFRHITLHLISTIRSSHTHRTLALGPNRHSPQVFLRVLRVLAGPFPSQCNLTRNPERDPLPSPNA